MFYRLFLFFINIATFKPVSPALGEQFVICNKYSITWHANDSLVSLHTLATYVLSFPTFASFLLLKSIYTLQNIPAPHSDGITAFQVSYPINHELNSLRDFSFKYRPAELSSYISQQRVMLS